MKIAFVENPAQDEFTTKCQIIDGKVLHWIVRSAKVTQTLQEFITTIKECYDNVEYLLIYDIKPCDRYFCDQGCQPGHGCKEKYVEDNHANLIRYAIIPKEK